MNKKCKKQTIHIDEFSLMMKTFRLSINASTAVMSEICGLGVNGWRNYEKDSSKITKSNKNIIRFACTPTGFWYLLQMSGMSDKKKEKLIEKISLMLLEIEKEVFDYKSNVIKNYWKRFL